jgi:hypothetical protein
MSSFFFGITDIAVLWERGVYTIPLGMHIMAPEGLISTRDGWRNHTAAALKQEAFWQLESSTLDTGDRQRAKRGGIPRDI